MKPKTKLQFEVLRYSKELHSEETKMLKWAKQSVLLHQGFATKSRVVCMDCGERFSPDLVKRKKAVCPHCGSKLSIEQSRKTTLEQREYVAYAQVLHGFQVVRYFEITSHHKVGKPTKYLSWEILQHWIREDGKHETVARNHTVNYYVDSWGGDMEIRKNYNRWYSSSNKYDVYSESFLPDSVIKRNYTMYGIDRNLAGLTFIEAIDVIPKEPMLETLLKTKQYWLLGYLSSNRWDCKELWPSIKICIRNRYIVKDSQLWKDYIHLLRYFQKDLRNAKYVCPKNLKAEHDRLVEKRRKIQERERIEMKRRRAEEYEREFKEKKAHLLGVCIVEKDITIKTLDSVQEYLEEGDKLHHCVYTNEYFLKDNTLCLSARVDNQPVETIELNLEKTQIEQCRGAHNQQSPYHQKIIQIMSANLPVIAERLHPAMI